MTKPRSLCERTCLFNFFPYQIKRPNLRDIRSKRQTKEHHNPPGLAKKRCICTYRHNTLNITSVLKLAHFIGISRHSTATHATRARSLFAITLQAEQMFAKFRFEPSQCPRSAQITILIFSATEFYEVLTFARLSASRTALTSRHRHNRNLATSRLLTSPHSQTCH